MDSPVVTALEHYESCVDEGVDPCHDDETMRSYMARWDGPPFFDLLGDTRGKSVLDVGVGTGRVAREVLGRGCGRLTGIDISPKSINRARDNLRGFGNVELSVADVEQFSPPDAFDAAYSVLTFMHVADKATALRNVVANLRPNGRLVLSIHHAGRWLDMGNRKVELHPTDPARYVEWLTALGCTVHDPVPLVDTWEHPRSGRQETYGKTIATLVKATKG